MDETTTEQSDEAFIRRIFERYHGHMHDLTLTEDVRSQLALDLGYLTGFAMRSLVETHQAELSRVARGAWHMLRSLLAVREGATDEGIRDIADALDAAIKKAEGR